MSSQNSTEIAEYVRQDSGTVNGTEGGRKSGYSQSYLPDIHRSLPHSAEAEMGVLGSLLISPNEVAVQCVERTREEHFHIPAHRTIYSILIELWNNQQAIDFITLTQLLKDRGLLEQVGGAGFVTGLFTYVPTAANIDYYLDIVRDKGILRQIITTCTECVARSYDDQDQVQALLDEVEQKVFAITEARYRAQAFNMQSAVLDAIEAIESLYERRGGITGIPSGFVDLDKMTDGLHGAEMFVIAARPSMGKTALAMNIAEHVAIDARMPVLVFSLEMSSQQLVQRLLCSRAQVDLSKVRNGMLVDRDFRRLQESGSQLAQSNFFIDDTAGLSILELRAKARRFKQQHDIQLVVIDYLQLLRSTSRRAQENRQLEIAEISSGVKALAKELDIPIIVLAQLNRQPEQRSGGKPRLSDLRESGSIEQDADVVGLLVRSEYYAEDEEDREQSRGEAELIIAKQRNGPTGEVPLTFLKQFTRFTDRATEISGEP